MNFTDTKEKTNIKHIRRMEDILNPSKNTDSENFDNVVVKIEKDDEVKSETKKKPNPKSTGIPRGKPKSGRVWKSVKTKFSSIIKTKGIRDNFEKKQALRAELKRIKELSRSIKAAKQQEIEQRKERRRENLKRREENRKKSEVVQVITNTSKLKKMKKKHLRSVEKRDTNNKK